MEVGTARLRLSDQHHANHYTNSETRASLRVPGSRMPQGAEPKRGCKAPSLSEAAGAEPKRGESLEPSMGRGPVCSSCVDTGGPRGLLTHPPRGVSRRVPRALGAPK